MANNEKLVVTTYIINKGQPSQYFGLKTLEGDVLHYAPNNWKTEQGAYAWAKKKGYIVKDAKIKDNTFDNVKQVYTAQDKNGKVYYVYEGDYKDYKGTRHIFAVSSQTPEYVKSERNVAGTILPTKEEALKQLKMTVRDDGKSVILNNNFRKIKEDGDWTSYQYNGSDFDNAVFKIHQYNPSLIAFVSNGNRTITVRNKYLNDAANANMKTAEDIIKKYGGNPVGNVMGLQKTRFVGQDEIKNQHDFAIDLDKAGYKFYLINGKYRISPKDSAINDLTPPKYKKGQKFNNSQGTHEIVGYDPVRADNNRVEYSYRLKTPNGTYTNIPDWQLEKLVELGRYKLIDSSIKDDLTMVEKYKKSIIYIDDNGYYYHTPIGGRGAKAYKDNTKDINIVKKRIDNDYSFLYDSAVKDVSFVTGKNLKVGQKIIENNKIYEVLDIKDNSSIYSKIVTLKDIKTGKVEQLRMGYNYLTEIKDATIPNNIKDAGEEIRYLEGMKFNGIPYTGWAVQHWTDGYYTFDGKKPYIPSGGRDALLSIFKQGGFTGQWKGIKPDKGFESYFRHSTAVPARDKLIQSSSKEAFSKNMATEIKSGKDPKQAAAIAYSVQRANDSISQYKPGMDTTGLWQVSHIKNNVNQSLLVRANSKEEAINKVVKHSPNSEIIGVNEYPIPHFGEPILDSGFVDAKDRFYKVGTKIKEGNNILVVVKVDDKYVYLKHPNGKTYAYDLYDLSENLKMSPKWSYVDSAIKDADPVEVEKIIRKEKSALGITYYLFQTKSKSGATIYYEVTDKTYHGEPTYSGGGVISFSLQSANDSLDSHLLYDKLVSKYGKNAGRKRFLLGKNDTGIKDAKPYSIKYKNKQYKVYAKDEQTAVEKLNNLLNKVTDKPIK